MIDKPDIASIPAADGPSPAKGKSTRGPKITLAAAGAVAAGLLMAGIFAPVGVQPADAEDVPAATATSGPTLDRAHQEMTVRQAGAMQVAAHHLESGPFSRAALISQLEHDGFTATDATIGVDGLHLNWNAQAVTMARQYLDAMPFSADGLTHQLTFRGFTQTQAEHAVAVAHE
jgi:hypothetical protein